MKYGILVIPLILILSGCSYTEPGCSVDNYDAEQCSKDIEAYREYASRSDDAVRRMNEYISNKSLDCNIGTYTCSPVDSQRRIFNCCSLCFNTTEGLRTTYEVCTT